MNTPSLQPARVLGFGDATSVVIGAIVGVGIFFTPSKIAALTASADLALLTWGIAGVIAICGALVFAELGGLRHGPGAQYQLLRESYGSMTGFLFVFCNATAVQAGAIGIIAIICVRNICVAAGTADISDRAIMLFSLGLVAIITAANVVGVRWGARIQNITVIAKVGTLIAIGAIAATMSPELAAIEQPVRTLSPVAAVMAGLVPALFTFGGWQHALWIAGEVRDPARTLPRSIITGVLIVVGVYLLANWAYFDLLGVARVASSKALAADAVGAAFPSFGARLVAGAVAFSAFGVLNAQLLSGPRLIQSLASDGKFFAPFARLNPRFGTPIASILFLAVLAAILLFIAGESGIDRLLTGAVLIDSVFFLLTGVAIFVLRRRHRTAERPFRVPLYPFVPLVFIIGEAFVIVGAHLDPATLSAAWIGLAWIAGAAVLYVVRFRGKAIGVRR